MSNNKQSSIEWLAEQLKEYDFSPRENTYLIEIPSWILTEKIEKAKAMHKQEIIDAWHDGMKSDNGYFSSSEQYYTQTFKPE